MEKLTIIAGIEAKADQIELVKAALLDLVAPSRADAGCINYDLHQDNKNPAQFVVYENWESPEALQKHIDAPHFKTFTAATEGAIEVFVVNEMTQIG